MNQISAKNKLIKLLSKKSAFPKLCTALEKDLSYYPALTTKEILACNNLTIKVKEGCGAQVLEKDKDTRFTPYLQAVINPVVKAYKEKHPLHPFDDRKFRLDKFHLKKGASSELTLSLGPTMYQQYQADAQRSKEEAIGLMIKGMERANDPYFYFSKILGVTVVVYTKEGYVFLGERASHIDSAGMLGFVGGTATFQEDINKVDFFHDLKTELEEEIGFVAKADTAFQFVGIAGNTFTSELDLIFVYQSDKDSVYFENSLLSEHQRMVCIKDKAQAISLLTKGLFLGESDPKQLMYPTRFGLEYFLHNC